MAVSQDRRAGLDLPDHPQLLAEAVVLDGGELDEVLELITVADRRGGNIAHDPMSIADPYELAHLGR